MEEVSSRHRGHKDQDVLDPLTRASLTEEGASQLEALRGSNSGGHLSAPILGRQRGRVLHGGPTYQSALGRLGLPLLSRPIIGAVKRPYRVVVAKPGRDGHDRGAKVIARALRDEGFEVVYTGLHQTPEQVVQAVIQEDADAIGLSLLSGAHLTLVPQVISLLAEQGRSDVLVMVGGIVPDADIPALEKAGVGRVFTPGSPLPEIGRWLAEALDTREESLGV